MRATALQVGENKGAVQGTTVVLYMRSVKAVKGQIALLGVRSCSIRWHWEALGEAGSCAWHKEPACAGTADM